MPAIAKKKPTIVLQRTRHPLTETNRVEIVRILQPMQSGSIELYLQLKNAHWNVKGSGFSALHSLFDDASSNVLQFADELAEHTAILGGEPVATVQKLAAVPQLADAPLGMRNQDEFIKVMTDRVSYFCGLVRDCLVSLERNNDPVTYDVCLRGLASLEKRLWMIESHIQSKL
ncbi:MAG: DNA starvation/stationary phase protection protein [Betaproteobacteria bacterium]|nr:DNA starvation/stationary phase protection protein [Betaproteobacteria bacterium]